MKRTARPIVTRTFSAELEVNRTGDGRTVTAYAATFDDPYLVVDHNGPRPGVLDRYQETIDRSAFNMAIGRGTNAVTVLYNHGLTATGAPSSDFSIPLGTPLDIRPDGRGLLTVTRYDRSQLADTILQGIIEGSIRAQSFRGAIYQSARPVRGVDGMMVVKRMQLGLAEYGPSPLAANTNAAMVGVRGSELLTIDPQDLTDEDRAELRALLEDLDGSTVLDDDDTGTPPASPTPTAGDTSDSEPKRLDPSTLPRTARLRLLKGAQQ